MKEVVDPFLRIELLHSSKVLQHLDIDFRCVDQGWFDGGVGSHVAARTEKDVDDFLADAGPFRNFFRREFGIGAEPLVGGDDRFHIRDDDLGILLGEVGANYDAVPGRQVRFHAVEDLAGKSAERQQLCERDKVSVGVDLLLLKICRTDFRTLTDQLEEIRRIAPVLHRLQHHAMGGRPKGDADQLTLEVRELVIRRVLMDDETIAGAGHAVSRNRDKAALAFRILLEREPVDDEGIVSHRTELQLVGHHAVGDRRARGEVLPFEFELDVGILAVGRKVLLQETQLADDDTGRYGIGRSVLGADADCNRFASGWLRESQSHGRHGNRYRE